METVTQSKGASQEWFSWNAWATFFANIFDWIDQAFWGENRPIHSYNIAPLPKTISPETLKCYIEKNLAPKTSLAQRVIEQKKTKEAAKIIYLFQKAKNLIKQAMQNNSTHNYSATNTQLAEIEALVKNLEGLFPTYLTVPQTRPDNRVLRSYGLQNQGNNCFINSILQIVFAVPKLAECIVFGEGQHLIIRQLYQEYKQCHQAGTFNSHPNLAQDLRNIHKDFNNTDQHDAFEFFLKVFIGPLQKTDDLPFFFNTEERSYYRDYEKYTSELTESFLEDGGRERVIKFSSLQLTLPESAFFPTMETLIQSTLTENIPDDDDAYMEFEREGKDNVSLKLQKREFKIAPPPFLFVDLKRHEVHSQEFQQGGTFIGQKKGTPIAFQQTFFIPPANTVDGKGAKYQWVALINQQGGYSQGHYVTNVKTHDQKFYQYSDSTVRLLTCKEFLEQGRNLYGGLARRVECDDVAKEMAEQEEKNKIDQEIQRAGYRKGGDAKELELIALFNKYLNEDAPSIEKLQAIYDECSSDTLPNLVKQFFPNNPRDHLIELKNITQPSLYSLAEAETAPHIVAQYEDIKGKNLELANMRLPQIEKSILIAEHELELLKHLATLNKADVSKVAAILDPGLEKVIAKRTLAQLTIEKSMEIRVLKGKKANKGIRTTG